MLLVGRDNNLLDSDDINVIAGVKFLPPAII